MMLSWSGRRQLMYYGVGLVICAIVVWGLYLLFFTSVPTCHDGTQNQNERGVDCGGVCALVCLADTHPLSVLWARAFPVAAGYYSAAAYVRNSNLSAGARSVQYSFQLFDNSNSLVVERTGVLDLPPIPTVPVVENNIKTGDRTVARTLFAFVTQPVWYSAKTPVLRVGSQQLAADGSRYSVTVSNDSLSTMPKVAVVAVLFDANGVAKAASRSVVSITAKGTQDVVFTWPLGNPGVVHAEVTVLPPF